MPVPTDVIVVGAGPVGLALACRLVLSGYRVRVLEQKLVPSPHSRSIGIHPPALEILAEIGVADRLVEAGVPVREGFALSRGRVLGRLSFDRCPAPYRFVLSIPQWRTEEILLNRLLELDPDALMRDVQVDRVRTDDVSARALAADGRQFQAAWIVGCDGAGSTVRKSLGIPFPGASYADRYVMGDYRDDTDFGPRAAIFLVDDGLVESFPMPRGTRRWVVRVTREVEDPLADHIARLVRERTGERLDPSTAATTSAFGVWRALAGTLSTGRVLLAGDAAHVVSPIGGQGMNLGWLDTREADRTLTRAHAHPGLHDQILRDYSRRRRKAARRAAARSGFNMYFGRPSAMMPLKRMAVRGMLAGPWSTVFARRFTMRDL